MPQRKCKLDAEAVRVIMAALHDSEVEGAGDLHDQLVEELNSSRLAASDEWEITSTVNPSGESEV